MSRFASFSRAARLGALLLFPMILPGAGPGLIVVRASGAHTGTLEWQGRSYPCALGEQGIAPEGEKLEGDRRTPAGIFPLRNLWLRADKLGGAVVVTGLATTVLTRADGWCDAPGDPRYNQPVKLPCPASHEDLWRDQDDLYDLVVPLGYNDDPVVPGKGSAVFLHVARPGYAPTAGCVALARPDLLEVLRTVKPGCRMQILAARPGAPGAAPGAAPGPGLVQITPETHGVLVALAYAGPHNFTGQTLYPDSRCWVLRELEPHLRRAAQLALLAGLRLKVLDAYRPPQAQEALWRHLDNPRYVADPGRGSNHSRGTAVDVTLVDAQGRELDMGTPFDAMEEASHHFHPGLPPEVQRNRLLLLGVMGQAGFQSLNSEWWHYEIPNARSYPLIPPR